MTKKRGESMKGLLALVAVLGILFAVTAITAQNSDDSGTDATETSIIAGKGAFVISESPDPKKILSDRTVDILKDSGDDFDKMYIHTMIVHHEGGIAMAETILDKTSDPAIKDFANRMITKENDELEKMNKILDKIDKTNGKNNTYNKTNATNSTNNTNKYDKMVAEHEALNIVHAMLHEETNNWLAGLPDDEVELAFLSEMKDHHLESIKLAQVGIDNAENNKLQELSFQMLVRQLRELGQMLVIEHDLTVEPSGNSSTFVDIEKEIEHRYKAIDEKKYDERYNESENTTGTNTTNATNATNATNMSVNWTGNNSTPNWTGNMTNWTIGTNWTNRTNATNTTNMTNESGNLSRR